MAVQPISRPEAPSRSPERSQDRTSAQSHRSAQGTRQNNPNPDLTHLLGWFSVGLGLAEIFAPRKVAEFIGVDKPGPLPLFGLRELAAGIGILSQKKPTGWMWSRFGGDLMDLTYLGDALLSARTDKAKVAAATAAVAGITLLDFYCSKQLTDSAQSPLKSEVRIGKSFRVNASPEELYRFWRDFEKFPRFMSHLASVRTTGDQTSHWIARGPLGASLEWDAEITRDEPDVIAWRSLPDSQVTHSGAVRFARPTNRPGTVVRVEIAYLPPLGNLGAALAQFFAGDPARQIREDLRAFKQLIEAGEIPSTQGQPAGPSLLRQAVGMVLPSLSN